LKQDTTHGLPGWSNHYTVVGGDWSRMLVMREHRVQRPDEGRGHRQPPRIAHAAA